MIYSNEKGSVIDAIEDYKSFVWDFHILMFLRVVDHRTLYGKIDVMRNNAEDSYNLTRRVKYNLEKEQTVIDRLIKHV